MQKASKENKYHYNPNLQSYANQLRKDMTKAEACLWKYVLRNRTMKGYQFRRQRPVLNYIAVFMCMELLLIIEVDGMTHQIEGAAKKDNQKDLELSKIGFTVLRYSNWEVLNRIVDVDIWIRKWIDENAICPPPSPRQRGKKPS